MPLWWFILCVNLTRLRDNQRASKTLFLSVSLGVFPEQISIWISRLSKGNCLHQCRWASSNTSRAWREQKGGGMENLLSAWARTPIFSCPWTWRFCRPGSGALGFRQLLTPLALLVLSPLDWDKSYTTGFLGLQLAFGRLLGLPSLHNHICKSLMINLFLYIYLYLYISISVCIHLSINYHLSIIYLSINYLSI